MSEAELGSFVQSLGALVTLRDRLQSCLLYTSDAADERSSVDLGGRRIIKKKNNRKRRYVCIGDEE